MRRASLPGDFVFEHLERIRDLRIKMNTLVINKGLDVFSTYEYLALITHVTAMLVSESVFKDA